MKGVKFYLEYPNSTEKHKATVKNPGNHLGSVIAVFDAEAPFPLWNGRENVWAYEAEAGILESPNSPVGSTSVALDHLRKRCKRIPERLARTIHPKLFEVLDD